MNLKLVLIFSLIALSASGQQSFLDRLRMVNVKYKVMEQLEIEMELEVKDEEEKVVLYTEKMSLLRDFQRYHYRLGGLTMIMNDSSMIIIEQSYKQILVSKRSQAPKELFTDPIMMNLDSIMDFYEKPILVSRTPTLEQYRLKQKSGEVSYVDVAFNLQHEFLEWVSYKTQDNQIVTIRFSKFLKPTSINQDYFKNDSYFRATQTGFVAAAGFKGYQVSMVSQ